MKSTRERFLSAQAKVEASRRQRQEQLDAHERGRKTSLLAREIIKFSRSQQADVPKRIVPAFDLEPVSENLSGFLRIADLPDDYSGENLHLRVSQLYVTSRYFRLQYVNPEVRYETQDIYGFLAEGASTVETFWQPDNTFLRGSEGDKFGVPIKYESEDYNFVRNMTGLFMPQIIDTLQADGQ